jgi:predicted transcriptional regulator
MVRTQIYLSEAEREALSLLAVRRGSTQSALIREAVDRFVKLSTAAPAAQSLEQACGLWADRDDLDDLRLFRRELDRSARAEG